MPQLDFSTWIGQIFWLIVSFVAMYVLMSTFVVPRIQSIASRREQKISGDLKRAEELKAEAESILQDYTAQMEKAQEEAEEIIKNAREEAQKIHDKKIAEFNEQNNESTEKSLAKIKKAKDEAMKEIDDIAENIAVEAINKVAGIKVDKKEINKAIKLVK